LGYIGAQAISAHSNRHFHRHPDADPLTNPNCDRYANAYTHADAYLYTNSHTHPDANANAFGYPDAHRIANSQGITHRDTYTHAQ
jgi:hypothetical protein